MKGGYYPVWNSVYVNKFRYLLISKLGTLTSTKDLYTDPINGDNSQFT